MMSDHDDEERSPTSLQDKPENDSSTAEDGSDGVRNAHVEEEEEDVFNTIDHMKHAVFFFGTPIGSNVSLDFGY
jgi:hypothetical protein